MIYRTWQEHFFEHVLVGDGCWGWSATHDRDGYGLWQPSGDDAKKYGLEKKRVAHRVMWELLRGPIPPEFTDIDHLCKFRGCMNPDHLEPVTHLENMKRAKAYCKAGHRLAETRYTQASGRSCCGVCYRAWLASQKAARHARGLKKSGRKKVS